MQPGLAGFVASALILDLGTMQACPAGQAAFSTPQRLASRLHRYLTASSVMLTAFIRIAATACSSLCSPVAIDSAWPLRNQAQEKMQ